MPNFNKALLGLMAASYASTATAGSYSREVDRMGIYKSVRTIMGADQKNNVRKLQDTLLTTRCFTHCIEQSLTPEECQAYIESEITAAGGHEVGPVTVKIQEPRPQESFDDTYWMTEVPVNLYGQMTCDRADGIADYPFLWTNPAGEGVAVPVVDCQGLTGGECCMQLRQLGESMGKDENGNCLACFPHQEPLVPVIGEGGGSTIYLDYEFDGTDCVQKTLTPAEVGAIDEVTGTAIISAASALKSFRDSPTCDGFESLLMQLYDAAVVIPSLPQYIGRLACDYCYSDYPTDFTTPEFTDLIAQILSLIEPVPEFDSTENCVIIYTNKNGDIAEVPKLGGSRADDPYDDDCPPDGTPSDGTPNPDGGDGTVPPDGGDGTVPPDGGENTTPPDDGTPSDGGDGTVPPDGGENTTPDDGTPPDGADGTTPTDGNDVPGETCYEPAVPAVDSPFGEYSTKACAVGPGKEDTSKYSLIFLSADVAADKSYTVFKYEVCTADPGCKRRQLKGGKTSTSSTTEEFNDTAAISHVTIGIESSSCVVLDYTFEGIASEELAAETGTDATTCVSGFKYENGWDGVVEDFCEADGDLCRELTFTVAGAVPATDGSTSVGTIKASTVYYEYAVEVPDCSNVCV